jgi:hypothetical protein
MLISDGYNCRGRRPAMLGGDVVTTWRLLAAEAESPST